jgi:carbon-monoxide dehydrogenase medium subunit
VFRWREAERALESRFEASAVDALVLAPDGLNDDIHASAEYRAHCVQVMAKRAVQATR